MFNQDLRLGMSVEDFQFDEIAVIKKKWMVSLEWIGEGVSGDYDAEDDEDYPMLRLTISKKDGKTYEPERNGSFCTYLRATDERNKLFEAANLVLEHVSKYKGDDKRFLYQDLSYIHLDEKGNPSIKVAVDED
jgi:hypothetical protein